MPDINREYHVAETKRSRRFPKHVDAIFLVQVLGELTRKGALLDLLLVKRRVLWVKCKREHFNLSSLDWLFCCFSAALLRYVSIHVVHFTTRFSTWAARSWRSAAAQMGWPLCCQQLCFRCLNLLHRAFATIHGSGERASIFPILPYLKPAARGEA